MSFRVVLLLGLIALTWGQSTDEIAGAAEPEGPVCSKVMCRMFCPYGFKLDNNGCPKCMCNDVEPEPCPMPMCANECQHGYKNNEAGCMTCDCRDEPHDSTTSAVCENHPCPEKHQCVAVKMPFCALLGESFCEDKAMCLPDGHNDLFLPHLPEHIPGEIPELKNVPEAISSVCEFRKKFADKLVDATKMKYANHSMLGRILRHEAMHAPWCRDDGKFRAMQCHAPERACWCVNDRGIPVPGSRVEKIQNKAELPSCLEHVTQMIEGSFLLQHGLDDVEPHLTKIASLLKDHMAEWMKIDHAQIIIKQVSKSSAGMLEVHFSIHRTNENEIHSAELMMSWHMGRESCALPYEGTVLRPQHKTLKMEHFTDVIDDIDEECEIDEGQWMREKGFMALYHKNKVAVICGGVGIFIFGVFFIAVIATVLKRGRVTSAQFKHKRMTDKSKTYKENLAFANEVYAQEAKKPGLEITEEKPAEEKASEEEKTETDA